MIGTSHFFIPLIFWFLMYQIGCFGKTAVFSTSHSLHKSRCYLIACAIITNIRTMSANDPWLVPTWRNYVSLRCISIPSPFQETIFVDRRDFIMNNCCRFKRDLSWDTYLLTVKIDSGKFVPYINITYSQCKKYSYIGDIFFKRSVFRK